MPGKGVQIDGDMAGARPARAGSDKTFQELADEAFAELLKKNNRPVGLNDALRKSAGHSAIVHHLQILGPAPHLA
jgi:hypothetical protein